MGYTMIGGKSTRTNFPQGEKTPMKNRIMIMKVSNEGRTRDGLKDDADDLTKKLLSQVDSDRPELVKKNKEGKLMGYDRPIIGIDLFDMRYKYYHPWGFNHSLVNKDGDEINKQQEYGELEINSKPVKRM